MQIRSGGTGECPVRDGVGRERRTSQHHEEADHPGDDRHDGGDLPRVGHEPREHQTASAGDRRDVAPTARRAIGGRAATAEPGRQVGAGTISATMKKLTGRPRGRRVPVEAVVGQEDAQPGGGDAEDARRTSIAPTHGPGHAQCGRGGPISRAVERMEPMAIDDRPTATARASMNEQADGRSADSPRPRRPRR